MDIKDWLDNFCTKKGWRFVYGRKDEQNLVDVSTWINSELEGYGYNETFLFLDPYSWPPHDTGITYIGQFMVLVPHDLDDTDEARYEKCVKPLKPHVLKMSQELKCLYDVDGFKPMDVYNLKDINGSGVHIGFNLKSYSFD